MSDTKEVTPEQARELLSQGHIYVDVRSEREFEAGHPPGALNVPIPPASTGSNEFLEVMQRAFGKAEPLILGCQSGPRTRRAAQQLRAAGFTEIVEMSAGFSGGRDAFGRPVPGWATQGLPVETGKPSGQAYADVKERSAR